jgi:hypothetical protein
LINKLLRYLKDIEENKEHNVIDKISEVKEKLRWRIKKDRVAPEMVATVKARGLELNALAANQYSPEISWLARWALNGIPGTMLGWEKTSLSLPKLMEK